MYFLQVLRTAIGHRLAKVQGYLFKSAFLRRVPTFTRLIIENLLLCFLQSTVYQTSKYLTGSIITSLFSVFVFDSICLFINSNHGRGDIFPDCSQSWTRERMRILIKLFWSCRKDSLIRWLYSAFNFG